MKYISMNMDPKGNKPAAGIIKDVLAYHGATGMGLTIHIRRSGINYKYARDRKI
jgi:hypothetical protein